MYSNYEPFQLTRGLFWCLFPELRSNEGNKYQNNARLSAETVRHENTYIILYFIYASVFTGPMRVTYLSYTT